MTGASLAEQPVLPGLAAVDARVAEMPGADAILARAAGENFPVALRLLPAAARRPLQAIYGFARLADELGDAAEGDRLALLDALEADLHAAFDATPRHPLLRTLAERLRERPLPREPFLQLIEANRRDQRVHRYRSWTELRGYCALSAEPVGRLVLAVFGAADAERCALSDDVCSALQLIEHCQDVAEDRAAGRVYLPAEDLARFGVDEAELDAASASPALRGVLALQFARARQLLSAGQPLVASLRGPARLAVLGFVSGGAAALDALERTGGDVLAQRATPRRRDGLRHALRGWRRARAADRAARRAMR